MTFDRFLPCPGGTGKKIKFCCKDLLTELEVIQRMLEGEQRLACLEHVQKVLAKYPDRACLLAIQALLQSQLGETESLLKTLEHFDATHPNNPVGQAERAMHLAQSGEATAAIEPLHRALESIDAEMPTRLYEAIGAVGRSLLAEGHVMAAQAHLLLQAAIGGSEDPRAMKLLIPLMQSPNVPVLLKEDWDLGHAPENVPWQAEFDEARHLAMRGAWLAGAERFEQLRSKSSDAPALIRNLALLRSWLAQVEQAVAAWRCYAALSDVALEDAVEAEAVAQLLDPRSDRDMIDLVAVTYPILDFEVVIARLSADNRADRIDDASVPPFLEEGQPPPQAAFMLLDRPLPETGAGIASQQVPCVVGQCYLFGKETDREARLEYVVYRDDNFDAAKSAPTDLAGDSLGPAGDEKVLTQISRMQSALTWRWRLPPDTPRADRERLDDEQRQSAILDIWTNLGNDVLDGKTPHEVAGDEAYRVRLLAAILVLSISPPPSTFDFNELRRRLKLPELEPIDPTNVAIDALPLMRLDRLEEAKLTDEQLVEAYRRSATMHADAAVRKLAAEVVARPSLDDQVDKQEAYGFLIRFAIDTDQALVAIEQASTAATDAGHSPAQWLLAELEVRLARGEAAEFERVLTTLRNRHMKEPGVAQAIYELMARLGLIPAEGQAAAPGQAMPPDVARPASDSAAASEIWTPGSETATPGKKSAIWTPDS